MINKDLKTYIETFIIPNYTNFDKGHGVEHVNIVINESLNLAKALSLDLNMAYTIAAYHDLGLCKDRETHHLVSGKILTNDNKLKKWFSCEKIQIMKEAIEDHRASSKNPPRSIYGKVVAEADRAIEPFSIIRRTIQYSINHDSKATKEIHFKHLIEHMDEKYAEGGYLKLFFENSKNATGLKELRKIINDKIQIRKIFEKFYEEEIKS